MATASKTAPAKAGKGRPKKAPRNEDERAWLRTGDEPRAERRFAPAAGGGALLGVLATSFGAILLGAGVWGRFFRAAGPHEHAVYLLGAGAVLFAVGFFLGGRGVATLRVGDAGVAIERDGGAVDRLEWYEVESIRFAEGVLSFVGAGRVIAFPAAAHPEATAHALAEARARIPHRTAGLTADGVGTPSADAGERLVLEPAQLAGSHCKKSDRLLSFEKDGRLCGRCGEVYHREEAPRRCLVCDARLG